MPDTPNNPQAILLAAGKGTRMGSDLPKVLHPVAGRPMLDWVVDACLGAGVQRVIVVVGHRGELVRESLANRPECVFVEQAQQLGTAHAVEMARPLLAEQPPCPVFVLAGDGPLVRQQTLARLLEIHRRTRASATLATALVDDPTGYGRVLRNQRNQFDRIVEQKDANPAELAVREINPSYYCFQSDDLLEALSQVRDDTNAQGEYYLTDVPALLRDAGRTVTLVDAVPAEDVLSINNPTQLAQVDALLRQRLGRAAPPPSDVSDADSGDAA